MDSEQRLAAIRSLTNAMQADLDTLPEEQWSTPSDCAGWTIAHAVVHLVQVAELVTDSIQRGRAGDHGAPPLAASEGIPAWRAARTKRNAELAAQSPAELARLFREQCGNVQTAFATIPGAPEGARAWHPAGDQPLVWYEDQWLFECALHDWDMRAPRDPDARIREGCLAAFAETLPPRLGRGFKGADVPILAGRYRIEFEQPQFAWVTNIPGDGTISYDLVYAFATDVTIRTDPTAFALVMTNRRPAQEFSNAGRWDMYGASERAMGFCEAFQSY
ncbi:MAG: maleylpyruvate isomerase family mycothiol-dependent enzyme [Chloroflexota bacterium]